MYSNRGAPLAYKNHKVQSRVNTALSYKKKFCLTEIIMQRYNHQNNSHSVSVGYYEKEWNLFLALKLGEFALSNVLLVFLLTDSDCLYTTLLSIDYTECLNLTKESFLILILTLR